MVESLPLVTVIFMLALPNPTDVGTSTRHLQCESSSDLSPSVHCMPPVKSILPTQAEPVATLAETSND